jgi:hypothetical protein
MQNREEGKRPILGTVECLFKFQAKGEVKVDVRITIPLPARPVPGLKKCGVCFSSAKSGASSWH